MARTYTRSFMWAEACALIDEAERMHRRFFDLLAAPGTQPTWEPPVNVFAADGELLIVVALPGANLDHIGIEIGEGVIDIEAHVPAPVLARQFGVVRLEVPYGVMRRHLDLPPGRYGIVERRLDNGCLQVHLRLREATR
jgi:HSP20 family protein